MNEQPTPNEERDAVLTERLDWEAEQEAKVILAIEQEAVAKYRRELREKVEAGRRSVYGDSTNPEPASWNAALSAVFALLGEPNDD